MPESIQGASPILLLEFWKPVPGFEGYYEITNTGRVSRVVGGGPSRPWRVVKQDLTEGGYLRVPLSVNNRRCRKSVHSLVVAAFIGPRPEGMQINHLDGNKRNNRLSNLEYVTAKQNVQLAVRSGLFPKTRNSVPPRILKLTRSQFECILAQPKTKSIKRISEECGVSVGYVCEIRSGKIRPNMEGRRA